MAETEDSFELLLQEKRNNDLVNTLNTLLNNISDQNETFKEGVVNSNMSIVNAIKQLSTSLDRYMKTNNLPEDSGFNENLLLLLNNIKEGLKKEPQRDWEFSMIRNTQGTIDKVIARVI